MGLWHSPQGWVIVDFPWLAPTSQYPNSVRLRTNLLARSGNIGQCTIGENNGNKVHIQRRSLYSGLPLPLHWGCNSSFLINPRSLTTLQILQILMSTHTSYNNGDSATPTKELQEKTRHVVADGERQLLPVQPTTKPAAKTLGAGVGSKSPCLLDQTEAYHQNRQLWPSGPSPRH